MIIRENLLIEEGIATLFLVWYFGNLNIPK